MEEKYEKALLKARAAKQNTESAVTIGILEDVFPELRESEDEGRVQPKQEWSEEDESLRLRTIGALETCKIGSPTKCVDEQINWLKSLKERIGG